jgi:hypothetical protein
LEIPISKAEKPKTHAVDPKDWKDDGRNPSNIPSLKKQNSTPKPHKRLKVKKMPDVQPALEQLFEKEERNAVVAPYVPEDINEAKQIMDQVIEIVTKKGGKRLSETISETV